MLKICLNISANGTFKSTKAVQKASFQQSQCEDVTE